MELALGTSANCNSRSELPPIPVFARLLFDSFWQFSLSLLALVACFTSYVFAVSPIEVRGADFVNSVDGTRFQMIGVA